MENPQLREYKFLSKEIYSKTMCSYGTAKIIAESTQHEYNKVSLFSYSTKTVLTVQELAF